jgi:protein ImuB
MPRVASLFVPTWSTDRFRRKPGRGALSPDAPLVLTARQANRRIIVATDRAAQAGACGWEWPPAKRKRWSLILRCGSRRG